MRRSCVLVTLLSTALMVVGCADFLGIPDRLSTDSGFDETFVDDRGERAMPEGDSTLQVDGADASTQGEAPVASDVATVDAASPVDAIASVDVTSSGDITVSADAGDDGRSTVDAQSALDATVPRDAAVDDGHAPCGTGQCPSGQTCCTLEAGMFFGQCVSPPLLCSLIALGD